MIEDDKKSNNAIAELLNRPPEKGGLSSFTKSLAMIDDESCEGVGNYLLFRLGREVFAFDSAIVSRVRPPCPGHRIPHIGPILNGLRNVDGELLLSFSMPRLLGVPRDGDDGDGILLVISGAEGEWGFETDGVLGFSPVGDCAISPVPVTLAKGGKSFAIGVVAFDDGSTATVLDGEMVFAALKRELR